MCGLTGLWFPSVGGADALQGAVERMTATIVHRGPDDSGVWLDGAQGVALGFRRLSIVDLSPQGHQPMRSVSGRYTMVFNGEVYNHPTLRRDLQVAGATFRGRSDTEVMLAAFERWGIANALRRFVGMFAVAVWDAETRTLTLARDRLGIKPLFYYSEPGYLAFGSELKTLVAGSRFERVVDRNALAAYLRHLYVPAPHTIWRGARKLLPGHLLTVRDPGVPMPQPEPYWQLDDVTRAGHLARFDGSDEEAITALDALLGEAVAMRMVADVPVGALLSGGVDSSAVVALMQASSSRPVKTYTIAFDDPAHDESAHAARVARHIGTDHTEMMVSGREALEVVPRLPEMFDEPHADPSQIPTYLVCALARREVTVALTGDGGDELFGGYNRYVYASRMLPRLRWLPRPARRLGAAGIGALAPEQWDKLYGVGASILPARLRHRFPGEKLHKTGRLLEVDGDEDRYRSLLSSWQSPTAIAPGTSEPQDGVGRAFQQGGPLELLDRMMLADQGMYLPDDLLAKVDRASMAVSLEARVPILDHRVAEFSWRLPGRMRIRDGEGKWILRQLLYRRVPRELVDRPKVGFSVPIEAWLRGPLREWAQQLLAPSGLARDGMLDPAPIARAWERCLAGRGGEGLKLWAVLMFQAWRERWQS
jgi:asparagine synthase (glutamine-hydrolysing)